jgi:alpha-N-acetylglucosaminidase
MQLDWMALRGINLPLAWVGAEQIFIDVFRDVGFTDEEILSFLSGPAFLAWNHFGNIQGSWGGDLPLAWAQAQQVLQKKIIQRMLELGMLPILPAFPGFVPRGTRRLFPDAKIVNGSKWTNFPDQYTNDTFLDPLDPLFADLQRRFIIKQREVYGDVSNFYALDQYNEIDPLSNDPSYLRNISTNTWKTLKSADEEAVWVMQGWLFTSSAEFWTDQRIEAFLGGVPVNDDMLILDLFSESEPQWQRTSSYHGKPWVWCQLHNYGGNMGLYGQVMNLTVDSIKVLDQSPYLVGFGLSMESQEGNEIVYDLLLDQAWSRHAIDTKAYFRKWVTTRYWLEGGNGEGTVPQGLYNAWEMVRLTVYNNTNLTANSVPKSLMELAPSTSGLIDRIGHHPTVLNYDPKLLQEAWGELYGAGVANHALFANPGYRHDLIDWTRQLFANAFIPVYKELVATYEDKSLDAALRNKGIQTIGRKMLVMMMTLDRVLNSSPDFSMWTWIKAARATATNTKMEDLLEFQARNQVTLWGPNGEITDYASKSWSGLILTYYVPRWRMFIDYLLCTEPVAYDQKVFEESLLQWEIEWCQRKMSANDANAADDRGLAELLADVVKRWPEVFGGKVSSTTATQDGDEAIVLKSGMPDLTATEKTLDRSRL